MVHIFHKGKFYKCPENWNELTQKQLVKIMPVLASHEDSQKARILLFKILTGWGWWKIVTICGFHRMKYIDKVAQRRFIPAAFGRYIDNTERLSMAVDTTTEFLLASNTLTIQLIPNYKGFYGPSSSLANLKMGEFCFTEFYFTEWKQSGNISNLNNLIATLYRPGIKTANKADSRVAFDPANTPLFAKKIDAWPIAVKLAIEAFYDGARDAKIEANKHVFDYDTGEESTSLHGLWSVMRSVAKAGHFGKFDDVANEYVDTILMELAESIAEYEKHKAELEANKHTHQ
jgi:hypothetical protein